jgi:3-hydroxyisobutyrate dehydrogenase
LIQRIVTSEGLVQDFPLYVASAAERLYQFAARIGYEEQDDSGLVRIFLAQSPSLVSAATHYQSQAPENALAFELICQLLEIVHTLAAIEALALGHALGLSITNLVQVIANAAGASRSFKKVPEILAGNELSKDTIKTLRDRLVSFLPIQHDHQLMGKK